MLRLSKILSYGNIDHIILSSDPAIETDTIFYFPAFYLYGLYHWNHCYQTVFTHEKIYNISCLNKGDHGHRIQNFVTLIEKNYNDVLYTWNSRKGDGTSATLDAMNKYQNLIEQRIIPKVDSAPINFTTAHDIKHNAYQAAYINIITETLVRDSIFISEKTWKPIASGQLFFMVGCFGTIQYLRDLGVDVFDDIIDHSYDLDTDWVDRIDRMHDSLGQLMQQDLSIVFKQTKDRRQRNQELFFNGKFGVQYLDKINLKFQ